MNFPSLSIPQDQMTLTGTKVFLHWFVWLMRNGIKIAGVVGLLVLDIYTGPYFMGGLNETGSPQFAAVIWSFSLALIAFQMGLWDYAIKRMNRSSFFHWQTYVCVIFAMILMTIDTLLDIGFVTQLLDPGAGQREVFAQTEQRDLVWWMFVIAIPGMCLVYEPMMMWLLRRDDTIVRSGSARLFDQDEETFGQIMGEPLVGHQGD